MPALNSVPKPSSISDVLSCYTTIILNSPVLMTPGALSVLQLALAELQSQLKSKQDDIEELRADKTDLRSQNVELKLEIARLRDELRETRSKLTVAPGVKGSGYEPKRGAMRSGRVVANEVRANAITRVFRTNMSPRQPVPLARQTMGAWW